MGEDLPRVSAAVIGSVVVVAIIGPLILLTGIKEFFFALLPGIGVTGMFPGLVEMVFGAKRHWVIRLIGWTVILLGTAEAVAVVIKYLHASPWVWPAAIGAGLIAALFMYRQVAAEVVHAWMRGSLLRYTIHTEIFPRTTSKPARALSITLPIAKELIGVRPPPFVLGYHRILNEIAEFQLDTARTLGDAGDLVRAVTHSAESAALRRHMTGTVLGRPYLTHFADSLALETYYLDLSERTGDAVIVGAEQIALLQRILAGLRADATTARDTMKRFLADALTRQSERMERLGRKSEAEQLGKQARAVED
ncbi:hypothetical protein [Nocardia sp. NPDC052566]|uniref:hypothetical protein n=1 Tax=Nocardia sp. NPDC052566 TaxID=3364330 RepID=UPI0037CB62EC